MKIKLSSVCIVLLLLCSGRANAQPLAPSLELITSKSDTDIAVKLTASGANTPIRIIRGEKTTELTIGKTATSVDISGNGESIRIEGALDALTCNNAGLSCIKTSEVHPLTKLIANGNSFLRFDASIFPNLTALSLTGCNIEEIDLSKNTVLTNINLNDNRLKSLTLTNCKKLTRIQFMNNGLTACALDALYRTLPGLSEMPKTVNLYNGKPGDSNEAQVSNTRLAEEKNWKVNFAGDASGCIDAETNPQLSFITEATDELTFHIAFPTDGPHSFAVDPGNGQQQNYQKMQTGESLIELKLIPQGNKITFYGNFKRFEVNRASITEIDTRFMPKLQYLGLRRNNISRIDLSQNTELRSLYMRANKLTELDLSHCPNIEELYIRENKIENIDLSIIPNLRELAISHNPLKGLDLTPAVNLTKLYAMGLGLENIDVSNCSKMYQLEIGGNKLTSLDLKGCPELGYLNIEQNNFSACALDSIFRILPIPTRPVDWKNLLIGEGENDAAHSYTEIAERRGWKPTVKGDASGCDIVPEKPAAVMTTTKETGQFFAVSVASPGRKFAIDFGDGTLNIYEPKDLLSIIPSAKVAGSEIKIYGQGITQLVMTNDKLTNLSLPHCPLLDYLQCSANELTTIDVRHLPALERLYLSKNKLRELDVTGNKNLSALFIRACLLDSDALNSLIAALPDVTGKEITEENEDYIRQLGIRDNPGIEECSTKAAIDKGWIADVGLLESVSNAISAGSVYMVGELLVVEMAQKTIELFDSCGQLLHRQKPDNDRQYIDLSGFPRGGLIVRIDGRLGKVMH